VGEEMKVKIKYIKEKGNQDKEKIVMIAMDDCNIGDYLLMDTTYDDNMISNKLRHTFWFPDKKIKKGDLVILYTKKGTDSEKINETGNKSHFFYWDLEKTIWNEEKDCAVLFQIDEYVVKES
jgi:hypothetical protein